MAIITAFHGTTDNILDQIILNGLIPQPHTRIFSTHCNVDWEKVSLKSLDGVYFAIDPWEAFDFAENAAEKRGGSPLLIQVEIDEDDILPDEDRIPFSRMLKYVMESLDFGFDSDDRSRFRVRMIKEPSFRKEILDVLCTDVHKRLFRSPYELQPDKELLMEAVTAWLDRSLSHLSNNEYVIKRLKKYSKYIPFGLPASIEEQIEQENRCQKVLDKLCFHYRHLALDIGFKNSPNERTFRILESVEFSGKNRIVAMGIWTGNQFDTVPGVLLPEENALERISEKMKSPHYVRL